MKKIQYEHINSKSGNAVAHIHGGIIQGVKPAETWAGYLYWLFQVPPFKPMNMLMLGYGLGTVAELTRKIWGQNIKCLGIDIEHLDSYSQDNVIISDAFQWIETHKDKHDYIAVDLFEGRSVCPRIFSDSFLTNLSRILDYGGLASIHFIGAEVMNQENKELIEKYFTVDKMKTVDTSWIVFLKHKGNTSEYGI